MSPTEEVNTKDATATTVAQPLDTSHNGVESGVEEAASKPEYAPQYVTGFKLGIIVASVALGCFLMLVDTMVISTAIPQITDEFLSLTDVGWYASAYQFGISAPQPLIGKIYTYFRTKWTFLVCFGVFELGSVLCGAANSSSMLIIGRAVAGLGAAGIINGAITIVSSCAPLEKRPSLFGLTMGFQQLGLVVGPLIGGAFTSYSTWRWSFYINLPIGVLVVLGIVILPIPEQTPKSKARSVLPKLPHYLDLVGFGLFAPAVIMLLLALQYGGVRFAWDSSQVIGLFVGAAATAAVWFIWNYRKGDAALLPPAMIRRRIVWAAATFNAFQMAAIYGALYYLPIYFQAIKNTSAILSGVYIMPTFLPQLLMAGLSGGILQKMGYVIPLGIFATILLSIGSGLLSTLQPDSSVGKWVGYQIMTGIGSGAGLQLAILAIQGVTTGEELSSGMAFMVFTQSLAPAVILTLCNVILVESLKIQIPEQAPGVDPDAIIRAGATGFRGVVASEDLPGVFVAYANSLDRVFYLVAGCAAVSFIFLWGMGWQDLRKKNEGAVPAGQVEKKTSDEKVMV
ncbi:major facilitator superfamily domain-containing protein [Triangularia setosa]|uniref:Major facilitator superfamily domain-containing protein n=1 Tax=Triangularia setosa TaxID=2587417 RepID=A0AAN6W029_9PEZI|nr:major facilitator superfamily domain-containing protein [Podospora setosa]